MTSTECPGHRRDRAAKAVALLLGLWVGLGAAAAHAATVPGDYVSIQAAIDAVLTGALPDRTTINVQPGIYAERLTVGRSSKSFTLRGLSGPAATIVDAGGAGAALTIDGASGQIVVIGITFRNGARAGGVGGGFIFTNTSPRVVDCVFERNTAAAGGGGVLTTSNATFSRTVIRQNSTASRAGGLLIQSESRPVFTQVDIVNNASGTGGAGVANHAVGGGVQSLNSAPTFRGSRISGNSAKFAGGGIYHVGGFGGAPYRLTLEDTEVADNVAAAFSAADNPSEGGGINIEDNVIATLTRARILRNRANTGGGLNAYRARYDLVDSLVEGNSATGRVDGGIGGGITASSTNVTAPARPASILTLTRSLVRNNVGITGGGIVVTGDVGLPATLGLSSSVVDSNQAQNQGGGIHVSNTNMTAADSMIIRNTVAGGSFPFGGGLIVTTQSSAALTATTVAANVTGVYGGGVFIDSGAVLRLTGSWVYDNTAPTGGGGGLFVGPNGSSSATIEGSLIADNTGFQVVEHRGCPLPFSTLTNNVITPRSGGNDVFVSMCGTVNSVAALNAGSSGRASGNTSATPRSAHVLAVPAAGTSTTLVWSIARASQVNIAGLASPLSTVQATGTIDVPIASYAAFTVTASTASGGIGPLTAAVAYMAPPQGGRPGPAPSDFDGDGRSDVSVFRPSDGIWYAIHSRTGTGSYVRWGGMGDRPQAGDYDGDGLADHAVLRPSNYVWYIYQSSSGAMVAVQWGLAGDVPVSGDYDGDGRTDIAVWRPVNGTWYILNSSTGTLTTVQWGLSDDTPVPGDYDGDGRFDVAVLRKSTYTWYIRNSSTMTMSGYQWGLTSDLPVAADYDGDGRTDLAVFRPASGHWYVLNASSGAQTVWHWGWPTDSPVIGDFDGDGKADVSVYRSGQGTWYILPSSTGVPIVRLWGSLTDLPTTGIR